MTAYLTKKQIDELESSIDNLRDLLIIRVLYETGCSVGELINIRRNDITNTHIRFPNRESRVSKQLITLLITYCQRHTSPYVFPSRQKQQITPKRVQQITRKYLVKLGVKKTNPHVLRYTHIVHAVNQNIPFTAIMQQTGLGEARLSQIITEFIPPQEDPYRGMFS